MVKEEVVAVQEEKPEKNGDVVTDVAVVETTAVVPIPEPLDVSDTRFPPTSVIPDHSPMRQWKSALSTVVFSVPSPVRALRLANLAINTLLLFAVVEFIAVPYFDDASGVVYTRVGALSPDAAKIVVRYPPTTNATENLVRLAYRQVKSTPQSWREGPIANLTAENDWVQTVRLTGLWPTTTYECMSLVHYACSYQAYTDCPHLDRFEDVNDANVTVLPYPAKPIRFHTFPDSRLYGGSHFRFIASSCMTPNFPYAPLQARRIKGLDLLADYLWPSKSEAAPSSSPLASSLSETVSSTAEAAVTTTSASSDNATAPSPSPEVIPPVAAAAAAEKSAPPAEFMVFMGDFIYADVPVYFGNDKEAYRRLYRRNYNSPSFRKVYERLREFPAFPTASSESLIRRLAIFHTYDDHEVKTD